ncbi:MAG: hypothetical protein Q9187_006349 [Circinaria calcarea]
MSEVRRIELSYNGEESEASAKKIIFTLFPDWENDDGEVKFKTFTEGITNTMLKVKKQRPGWSEDQVDKDSIVLRAYGKGTEVLSDREREIATHLVLSIHSLAPKPLARFENGMIYQFTPGHVCNPEDVRKEAVWKGIARTFGKWHAILPTDPKTAPNLEIENSQGEDLHSSSDSQTVPPAKEVEAVTPGEMVPNIWTVLRKWCLALSDKTPEEAKLKDTLQMEIDRTHKELGDLPGWDSRKEANPAQLVMAHNDLRPNNIIIQNPSALSSSLSSTPEPLTLTFIDYEYAAASPAAFDLALHLSEWADLDLNYHHIPTRSVRRAFLTEYIRSFQSHLPSSSESSDPKPKSEDENETAALLENLMQQVDRYRGLPGLWWGIWSLLQAETSTEGFDYGRYAHKRLGEYWVWRGEAEAAGKEVGTGQSDPWLRERRWMEE